MYVLQSIRYVIALTLFFLLPATAASAAPVGLVANGYTLNPEVSPVIENGRLLVPLRTAAEALHASVYYDDTTRQITITKEDLIVTLTVDSTQVLIGDRPATLEMPARLSNGRTLVPIRFLSEMLGFYVTWHPLENTAYLSENLLNLPGWTRPLTSEPVKIYRHGYDAGMKLLQPKAGHVEADTRVDLVGTIQKATSEVIVIVEKESNRSDQSLEVKNGVVKGQVWLPFGPGEYIVTVCSPPQNGSLFGLAGFKVKNTNSEDFRALAPIDLIDWNHPEVLQLARQLAKEDPMATVSAIHDWVAQNIEYDMAAIQQNNLVRKSASEVLSLRKGVCEHFSRLVAGLCRANGIPAVVVEGYARQKGEAWPAQPNHAWNEVLIGGNWISIDATWDSGYIEDNRFVKEFSREFFNPDPARFANTHRKTGAER